MRPVRAALILCALLVATIGYAQQVPDTTFLPQINDPLYLSGEGPVLAIDQAHNNFHTANNRFLPFAVLARREGFRVDSVSAPFSPEILSGLDILVISNAIASQDVGDWNLPNHPAFTRGELDAVREWVKQGGSLLLIADHMPMGAAARDLATQFGFQFMDGFARTEGEQFDHFRRGVGLNGDHPIANGIGEASRIDSVVSFTGQAFLLGEEAIPLLTLGERTWQDFPVNAWEFTPETLRIHVAGWSQGATVHFGQGRVAAFGEAAMFTAQLAGPQQYPIGMNNPDALQNIQFVRNTLAWLAGRID